MSKGFKVTDDELIKLYHAIQASFNQIEFIRLIEKAGFKLETLPNDSYQEETRELLLTLRRYGQIGDLIESCKRFKPDFNWETQVNPIGPYNSRESVTRAQLLNALSTKLTVRDLKQLCFLMGVDFENIGGYLIHDDKSKLSPPDESFLQRQNIAYEDIPLKQIIIFLKEKWSNNLLDFWQRKSEEPAKMADIVAFINPDALENN